MVLKTCRKILGRTVTLGLAVLFSVLFSTAPQSVAANAFESVRIERYLPEHGLSARKIYSTVEDADGFIWIASRQGLLRFDGYTFKAYIYDPADPNGPGASAPWHLDTDDSGHIWITTWGSGVDIFDTASGRFAHHRHDPEDPRSLSNDNVWFVLQHSSGSRWLGTDNALNRYDEKTETFTRFQPLADGKPQAISVSSIAEDHDGMLWLGTYGNGVYRFDPATGSFKAFAHSPDAEDSLGQDNIWSIATDSKGRVWIATADGLDRYDATTDSFVHYRNDPANPRSLASNIVNALAAGDNGQIWAGTRSSGISVYDPTSDSFDHLQHDPDNTATLSNNNIWRIVRDRTGAFWISTDGGLNRLDPNANQFVTLKRKPGTPNSLLSDSVTALARDATGDLWVGTDAGLSRFSPALDTATHFQTSVDDAQGLTSSQISALAARPNGTVWIGTSHGLNRYDPISKTITAVKSPEGARPPLNRISIHAVAVDADGALWIAAFGPGLIRYDPETHIQTLFRADASDPTALPTGWITTVMRAADGTIWVGSTDGMCHFDPKHGTCKNFKAKAGGLPSDAITALYQDRHGTVWAGTDNGLARYSDASDSFSSILFNGKPITEQIAGIAEDKAGHLWLSTSKGLHRISPQQGTIKSFDRRDGLAADLFNLRALHSDEDGSLYVGSSDGLIYFDPAKLKPNAIAPTVVLTEFRLQNAEISGGTGYLHGKQINAAQELVLKPDNDVFALGFAGLSYRNPLKTTYAYRLDGFSKDWTHVGANERLVTFTNLDPGTYTFRVKAANDDGVWNGAERTLDIVVQPFWWETRTARAGAIAAPIGLIALIAGWRLATLRRHNRALSQLADERRVAEEKTSVLAESLRRLIDGANAPIIAVDTKLHVTEWNAAAANITKTAGRDAKGQHLIDEFAPLRERERLTSIFEQALSGENTVAFEFPLTPPHHADTHGPDIMLLFSVTPQYDVTGKIVGAIGVGQDASELKRTEEVLRRSQKMDVVGQLAGGVAHDFNNLLAIMIGNLDLALEDAGEGSAASGQIEKVLAAASKASNLTAKLLSFSRQSVQAASPLNVNSVILSVIELATKSLTSKITVKTALAEDLWLSDIDPRDLEDALINLSLNARDAMPDGGQLLIQTQNMELGENYCGQQPGVVPGDYVMLSIGDTGAGIPQDVVPKIFDPFFTTKETGKGTGLGLAMVYAFIKRSGGHIDLQTKQGYGTTFRIFLPRSQSSGLKTDPAKAPDALIGGTETILVVDDEEELLQMVTITLTRAGYTVLSAADGSEAIELLEASPSIDLLLSDVVMPGKLNGLEVARMAQVKYPKLPIIMTSGFAEKMRYGEDYVDLLSNLLVKPYRRVALLQRIREALDEIHDNQR